MPTLTATKVRGNVLSLCSAALTVAESLVVAASLAPVLLADGPVGASPSALFLPALAALAAPLALNSDGPPASWLGAPPATLRPS